MNFIIYDFISPLRVTRQSMCIIMLVGMNLYLFCVLYASDY